MRKFYTIIGSTPLTLAATNGGVAKDSERAAEGSHPIADQHTETATDLAENHTTEDTSHAAGESEGIAALGLDPFAIAAQLLTFVVLFWIIKKFALSGIVHNLQKRQEDINRGLHLTAELDKEKAELDERIEEVLRGARRDADGILAEARSESIKIIQNAEEAAGRKAGEILRAAEGKIERDIAEARSGLRAEMAGLITETTEAVLGEKLNPTTDRKLVENYLKEALKK